MKGSGGGRHADPNVIHFFVFVKSCCLKHVNIEHMNNRQDPRKLRIGKTSKTDDGLTNGPDFA